MTYLLDTNIVLVCSRRSALSVCIDEQFGTLSDNTKPFISAVKGGELWSLCLQNKWGQNRQNILIETLRQFARLDINIEPIIQEYATIDAFSQNKLDGYPLSNFDHLHEQFVEVI